MLRTVGDQPTLWESLLPPEALVMPAELERFAAFVPFFHATHGRPSIPIETYLRLVVPAGRSGCPINLTMELLADRWSLVVVRDIMFGCTTRFREILHSSLEGIASNVLASRLAKLTDAGLLTRHAVPGHRQKVDYFLTEAAIELVPLLIELGDWGSRWLPTTPELAVRARLLADGGPEIHTRFMDELRAIHLDHQPPPADGRPGRTRRPLSPCLDRRPLSAAAT